MLRMHPGVVAIVVLFTQPSVPRAGGQADAAVVKELTRLEEQLGATWKKGDCDGWGAIVAPEWSVIHVNGATITRAQAVAMCASPSAPIETFTIDDVSVKVFGDAAVVTGRTAVTIGGKDAGTARLRFTDVFIRRAGRWQVVASQATSLADDPQDAAPSAPPRSLARDIVGTWRMVAFVDTDAAGTARHPFGERPAGYFVYDETGHVFIQIMRAPAAGRTSSDAFAAYFGTYRVDERRGVVFHDVEGSLMPGLADVDHERPIRIDGDTLTIDIKDATGRYYRELRRVK